jgi:arachidonate 15-lipoxygenase
MASEFIRYAPEIETFDPKLSEYMTRIVDFQLHPGGSPELPAGQPDAGFTEEPRGRDHQPEDWLANLPTLEVAVQQLCIMRCLGVIHETKLGDYKDDFTQTPVAGGLHGFQQDLSAAEDEIVGRNRGRPHTYDYLRPSLVPNSTNI